MLFFTWKMFSLVSHSEPHRRLIPYAYISIFQHSMKTQGHDYDVSDNPTSLKCISKQERIPVCTEKKARIHTVAHPVSKRADLQAHHLVVDGEAGP